MRGIFISYRRDDAEGQAGRLFDDLSTHFGRDAVFMDVAGIKKGLDFRRIIDEHVTSCGVLLVIIGKGWLSATDSKGRRRLDDVNDFVRLETAAALSRDIPVVPVLVHGAVMPTEQELPDVLKELAFRNGTELTHARWDSDVKLLIEDLRPYLETSATATLETQSTRGSSPGASVRPASTVSQRPTSRSLWAVGGAVVVVGAISTFGVHLWQGRPIAQDRTLVAVHAQSATEAQRRSDNAAGTPVVATPSIAVKPVLIAANEPGKSDPTVAQEEATRAAAAEATRAAAAKAAAAKASAEAAARAAVARREADERRRREEAERSAQLAEEQRRRDEENRRLALAQAEKDRIAAEKAEKQRIAAEQAAGAKMFVDFASAIIGSRQNNRR